MLCQELLEVVDVEITTAPPMVFFRLAVRLQPEGPHHHIMKRFADIQDFHRGLQYELGAPRGMLLLPALPASLPEQELAGHAFCAELNSYLARLARCPEAHETYSFRNFFQLSDDYKRWVPKLDQMTSPRKHTGGYVHGQWPSHGQPVAAKPLEPPSPAVAHRTTLAQRPPATVAPPARQERPVVLDCGGELGGAQFLQYGAEQPQRRSLPPAPAPVEDLPLAPSMQSTQEAATALLDHEQRSTPSAAVAAPTCGHAPHPAAATSRLPIAAVTAAPPPAQLGQAPPPALAVESPSHSECSDPGSPTEAFTSGGLHRSRRRPWCVVCMAKPQEVAVDPCGHISMCSGCASAVQACPMCRGPIGKMLRVYIS